MNDQDDLADDLFLRELLAPLKQLNPNLETQVAVRAAVANELQRRCSLRQQRPLPFWRRTISVPLPLAACLVVLAALALGSVVRDRWDPARAGLDTADQPTPPAKRIPTKKSIDASQTAAIESVLKFRTSETYLCGVGPIQTDSGYYFEEQNP